MVATIGKMASAAYYLDSQESRKPAGEYYSAGEEPDGVWYDPSGLLKALAAAAEGKDGARQSGGARPTGSPVPADTPDAVGGDANQDADGASDGRGKGRAGPKGRTGGAVDIESLREAIRAIEPEEGARENPAYLRGPTLVDGEKVDTLNFNRLYRGIAPDGTRLTRNAGSESRCPGLDMTFSADKSVSTLWAIADPETRAEIEAAQADAVRAALDEIVVPNCSFTRIRNEKREIEIKAADIFCAMFQHGSSREGDPQLHTHCTFFNLARTREDGKWRALYRGRPFFRWKMAAGAVYRMKLARSLQERLGVEIEQYGKNNAFTRIVGVPEDLEKAWSKRRQQMLAAAGGQGWSVEGNADRAASLNLVTRASKRVRNDGSEARLARWAEEAQEVVGNIEELVVALTGGDRELTGEQASELAQERLRELTETLGELPEKLTREEAVFLLPDVYERVANACAGVLDINAFRTAVERVLRDDEVRELDRPEASVDADAGLSHTRIFSTRDTIQGEEAVREMARNMVADERFGVPRQAVFRRVNELLRDGYPLSEEQIGALSHATRPGRVTIIEGAAGSGKTTTLRPLVDLYKEQGCNVIGAAVAWRVAVALGTECGIQPRSVTQLLRRAARGQILIDENTVIVVDEASLLSTRQMRRIQELSEAHGCKIVLCGDTQQQQSVEAGPGLRLVKDVAKSAVVAEMRRQKADYEDVLRHVDRLDGNTLRLKVDFASPEEQERRVAEFEALPGDRKPSFTPWQVTVSEAFRDCEAARAIDTLNRRGRFHLGQDLAETLVSLVDDWAAFRRENPAKSTVVLARTHREIDALSFMMRERALAERGDPERAVVEVCQGREDDYRTSPLEIARGDLLRIGATVWDKQLFNGTVVTVDDFREDGVIEGTDQPRLLIRGRTEHGRAVEFHHDEIRDWFGNIRLKHGYALTITSAQGMTVDRSFVLADDRPARETIYPAATRHRERSDLYVNREPLAADIAARRPEDAEEDPVTDDDIRAHLAKAWSRSQPKVAARDHMSDEMRRQARREFLEASREADPGEPAVADWLAANDNGGGFLRRVANGMRHAALDRRHGAEVAALGLQARELSEAWEGFRARVASDGNGVALDDGFGETLRQHRGFLKAAKPFRDPRFSTLLEHRAGIDLDAIDASERAYRRAGRFRRSVLATEARKADDERRSARIGAAVNSETATPTESSRAAQESEAMARTPTMREQLPHPRELAAGLAQRAEEVCRRYLPNGVRSGGYWHAGSIAGEKGQSLYVHLTGRRAGRWQDAAIGEWGDLLNLIQLNRGYHRLGDAMREAADFLGGWLTVPVEAPAEVVEAPEEAEAERQRLEKFLASARPILHDDPAGRHLQSRDLSPQLAGGLRYHPSAWVKVGEDSRQLPAILAPIRTPDGRLEAVHRIFITRDGGPAEIRGRKRNSGSPREGGVWFGNRAAPRVAICEGAEDALAIYGALTAEERERIAVVATLSAGRIPAVRLPDTAREVVLVRDRDAAGERSWEALRERHSGSGLSLACIVPELKDANAVLSERGPDALRRNLEVLVSADRDADMRYQRSPGGGEVWKRLGQEPLVREAVEGVLRGEMEKLGVGGARLRVVDALEEAAAGSYAGGLVRIALAPREEMLATLRHEVVHALRDFGAFTDREWAVLAERARREWLTDELREAYASLPDDRLIEEAIAEGYRKWYLGEIEVDGAARPLLERISRLIEAVRNVLLGRGWRTAEDIFRAVEHGEIEGVVRRPDVSGKDPIPVAEINSRFKHLPPEKALDEMEKWAKKNIRGVCRNADTGWDIQVARDGIKKLTHKGRRYDYDPVKLEILAAVPELLRSAVRYESEPDKDERPRVRAFHHFAGAVKLDGELRRIRLTVKEVADGRLFYDHCLLERAGPGVIYHVGQGRALNPIAGPAGPTITMAELFDGVKYRDRKEVLASVGERIVTDLNAADDDVQYRKAEASPSKDAFLGALRNVVAEHVGRERAAPAMAEETPSRETFLNAYRKAVAEPVDREAEATARARAARVFAELQADWKAHVAAARRHLGGHPFYTDGYDGLHRRMQGLAALPNLPDDARAFVEARLVEHDGLVAAERQVEKLLANIAKMDRDLDAYYSVGRDLGKPARAVPYYDQWRKDSEAVVREGERVLADPACKAALGKVVEREIKITGGVHRLKAEHQFEDRARATEMERRQEQARAEAEKERRQKEPEERKRAEEERARSRVLRRDQSRGRGMSM